MCNVFDWKQTLFSNKCFWLMFWNKIWRKSSYSLPSNPYMFFFFDMITKVGPGSIFFWYEDSDLTPGQIGSETLLLTSGIVVQGFTNDLRQITRPKNKKSKTMHIILIKKRSLRIPKKTHKKQYHHLTHGIRFRNRWIRKEQSQLFDLFNAFVEIDISRISQIYV